MTTPAPAAKPKRNYFNRPKWAAPDEKTVKTEAPANNDTATKQSNFFSRSNETFASIALEEEETERRKRERRAAAAAKKAKSPTPAEDVKPAAKRRRLSAEKDDFRGDGGDSSDVEAERAEEAEAAAVAKQAEKKESTNSDEGKVFAKDGTKELDMNKEQATPPSPSKLPVDVPRIPDDEDCDRIRAKNPKLAPYDNETIRQLALRKWEQKKGHQAKLVVTESPKRHLRSSTQAASQPRENGEAAVIELDDDESPPITTTRASYATSPAPRVSGTPITVAEDVNPDPEMAELERRAREKNKRKRLLEEPVLSPPPDSHDRSGPFTNGATDSRATPVQQPSPTVQLLLTSNIPGTRPLIIKREIDQRFKEVRQYWCHTNELAPNIAEKVLLRWKLRRLYDSQNCRSLGFVADSEGNAVYKDADGEISHDYGGKIHLSVEVEGMEQTAEGHSAGSPSANEQPTHAAEQPGVRKLRVTIQARGYQDFKVEVKSTTLISQVIGVFKKNLKIPDAKSIALSFEGEMLQPNSTVDQTEIDDLDKIDAYVR